jgi:hypothetical protein
MDESTQAGLCAEAEQKEHRCREHAEGWFITTMMDRIRVTPSGTASGLTEDTVDTRGSVVASLLPCPLASTEGLSLSLPRLY